jgi:seryl-tRNA synthetase
MEISDDKIIKLAKSIADQVCHIQPTQKTINMFEELDKKTNTLQKSIDSIENKLELQVQESRHLNEKILLMLDNHQKANDETVRILKDGIENEKERREEEIKIIRNNIEKKASMWVETTLKGLGWLVISTIIIAILKLLLDNK